MGSRDRQGREVRKPKKEAKGGVKQLAPQAPPVVVLRTKGKKQAEV